MGAAFAQQLVDVAGILEPEAAEGGAPAADLNISQVWYDEGDQLSGDDDSLRAYVRWVQSNAVLSMETEMRHDLYVRLQELPMAFHGRWQSGQLLSRVTNDLSSLRRFFGFGLIFLFMNILQLVLVTGVLLHMYWPLGLVVAATAIPVIWLSMRFVKAYVVVSEPVDTRVLQDHVKALIAPYKYPRRIEFVDALPRTPTGKVQRNVLRERSA